MPFRPSLRASVSRHEEKEQRLRQFVRHHMGASADPGSELMVVARSLESPVVKAIAALDQEIAGIGLSVRLILAHVEDDTPGADASVMTCKHEIRWARHPRLIEAHEQLVLGPDTCWIGDCMRRDPAKCDAFENYVEDCGEAAGCAAVSFERLWTISEPFEMKTSQARAAALPPPQGQASEPSLPGRH
jgi:hypothetical protein